MDYQCQTLSHSYISLSDLNITVCAIGRERITLDYLSQLDLWLQSQLGAIRRQYIW